MVGTEYGGGDKPPRNERFGWVVDFWSVRPWSTGWALKLESRGGSAWYGVVVILYYCVCLDRGDGLDGAGAGAGRERGRESAQDSSLGSEFYREAKNEQG